MQKIWLKQYPAGVPADVKTDTYPSLVALLDESFRKYRDQTAYKFMGASFSFGAIDDASRALAAWLQGAGLQRGDRVAIMMPNVPQYPVAVAAILRAGLGVLAWRAGTSTRPKRADAAASATRAARAAINGRWQADVSYDWPNAHYTERFEFSGEGTALQGSASFLRVDRGILEGRVDSDGLAFVTRTRETLGGDGPGQEITHRYLGQLDGDELRFVMQTEGGSSAHRPVSFVARRAGS